MLNNDFIEIFEFLNLLFTDLLAQHSPILVVLASIVFLWSLGKILPYTQERFMQNRAIDSSFVLPQGLHIDGLTSPQRRELKELIGKKDKLRLAMFFAVNQPTILEIKTLLDSMQDQHLSEHNYMVNFITDFKNILNDDKSEKLDLLDQNDIHSIQAHNTNNRKLIDKDFISKFGNLLFMENFFMYNHLCRTNPAIFYIPRDNTLRYMFETFVKTGLAIQDLAITMKDRLHILNLNELQIIANELNINKTFTTVREASLALANNPLTVVRLASRYASNDLFLLKQENWDTDAVKQEWSAYNAYAKLLCANPA